MTVATTLPPIRSATSPGERSASAIVRVARDNGGSTRARRRGNPTRSALASTSSPAEITRKRSSPFVGMSDRSTRAGSTSNATVKQANAVIAYTAVSVDSRESDTRPLALENLKSGENSTVTVLRGEEDLSLTSNTRQLWPQLAVAAAILLGMEMLLLALWRSAKTAPAAKPTEAAR